jgi:hypothetical protein
MNERTVNAIRFRNSTENKFCCASKYRTRCAAEDVVAVVSAVTIVVVNV